VLIHHKWALIVIFPTLFVIFFNHVEIVVLATIRIQLFLVISVPVQLVTMEVNVNMIIGLANRIPVGTMVCSHSSLLKSIDKSLIEGTCKEQSNTTFVCLCEEGWHGVHCEMKVNYCENVTCENNGVCRPLFRNYSCECLGDSYSGRHCEITSQKTFVRKIVSKSLSYIAILSLASVVGFIVIMDILKYGFGIDPVHEERERLRRKKQVKKHKPVIQRFVYVNEPKTIVNETTV
jgi:hypothetical protein